MAEKEMRSRSSPQAPLSVARAVAKVSAYIGGNDQHKVPAGSLEGNGEKPIQGADVIQDIAGQNNMISHAHCMEYKSI